MIVAAQFFDEFIAPFEDVRWFHCERGYIAWRRATGGNAELLHIRVNDKRRGHGTEFVREMVRRLTMEPPTESVFGFARAINEDAKAFYRAIGFQLITIPGLYRDGDAVLFVQSFNSLRQRFGL